MSTWRSFEDIESWKKSRELCREIYTLTKEHTFARDFDLKSQIRRAGISVMSNIAEGFGRGGTKEFIQFLAVARGSAGEVMSQLYIALDQNYLNEAQFKKVYNLAAEISKLISGLMIYLKNSKLIRNKIQT